MPRLRELFLLSLLSIITSLSHAAIQDFVNGKMVGQAVEPMALSYFGTKPDNLDSKVVLIDFWGARCEPCRHSIPKLNKLHTELGARGFAVLGVTRDDDESIAEFAKRFPMQFPVGSDVDGTFFKRLAVRAIPYAVLADRTGTIIWQGDPGELNRERIEAVLSAPAKSADTAGQ